MIEENFDLPCSATPKSKLYYPQPTNLIEGESQLLLAFLKQLTFQSFLLPQPSLTFEEVEKLKTIIDKLHMHARKHKITLKQIQGIWPLLSIMFAPINGLQLYLQFQKLLMPAVVSEVKQEQGYFSPNGYFQDNNDWKNDKNIMAALRILEKTSLRGSYQDNRQAIWRLYELIAVDKAQYLIITRDFQNRLDSFRRSIAAARKIQCSNKLTSLLSDSFFGIKGPTSQPDLLTNTLKMFSLKQIENIHETKTNKIVPILQEELEEEEYQASPSKQSQTMSPFKRKLRIGCSDTTKIPKQRNTRNNSRFYYAKKFFQLEKRQNIVLAEMKTKKNQLIRERHRRNKLQKMTSKSRKVNDYFSDEEDGKNKMRKKQLSSGRNKQKDEYIFDYESQVFSASEQMFDECLEDELSEEPVIRRNSKFLKRAPAIDPYFEMEIEEEYPFTTKKFSWGNKHQLTFGENRQQQSKGKYKRESIKLKQVEETRKTSQKIDNLQVRLLITEGGEGFNSNFDFWRYRRYLETLQGKQVGKEANKITIEVINSDDIAFDKSMLLKALTFFQISMQKQKTQPAWKGMKDSKVRLSLKFIITANIYRGICEVINCFFDRNEFEKALLQARQYFKILGEYVEAFKMGVGIQNEISQMIFQALLTPSKYRQFKNHNRFSSYNELVQFASPFLTARKTLKYHLTEHQELIAVLIGQFTFISLSLEKFFYDTPISSQRQKQHFSQLKKELQEMKNSLSTNIPFPFRTATILLKKFYLIYRPRLNDAYLKGLIDFFHLSFNQLLIQSIKEDTEEEAKEHINFVEVVFQDFIEKEFSKSPPVMGANVYSRLMKTQTKLKQLYESSKEANVALLFSTILSLLLKWPQFRAANLDKQLMGTFESTVINGLKNNHYKLKPALYSPILNCVYDLYSYKIELFQHADHQKATEMKEYEPMRIIINTVWKKLFENYKGYYKELQLTMQQKAYRIESKSKTELVIQKLKRCEEGFILFLTLFILDGAPDKPNFPKQSFSHRNFCLQFILQQQYFIKFFHDATNHPDYVSKQFVSCLSEVIHRWFSFLPTVDFFYKEYSSIILNRKYKESQRAFEFSFLSEVKLSNIQQSLANIYATELIITLIEYSQKGKPENFIDNNPVFKFIDQNIDPTLTSFMKISKSIQLFDYFLIRIMRFFEVEQSNLHFMGERAKKNIKKALYDFLKEKFLRKMTILIMLGALVKNTNKYQSIPLRQIVQNLKKLRLFEQKSNVDHKIPFECKLFWEEGIEKIQSFTGIQQVFSQIIKWRTQSVSQQQNKSALRGFESLLQKSYSCMKKLSSERQKQAVPIQWMKWTTFALQWPQIINHQRLFKERCAFSELKITTSNVKVFLKLLKVVNGRSENMYKIKEIGQTFVDKICGNPSEREQQLCKQIKITLMCIRHCLQQQQNFTDIGIKLVKELMETFCNPLKLQGLSSGLARPRLMIYFEMMQGSERERQGYESLMINNSKQFRRLIPRYMKGYLDKKGQLCETIESLILSCMIRKHSSLLDVKRLLTALKNSNSVLCSSKKAIYSLLFRRLERQAEEGQSWQLASWCKEQISEIQSDSLADWMDIE